MPLLRPGMPKPPPGFDVLVERLEGFEEEMKRATQEDSKGVVGVTTRPRPDPGTRKRAREEEEAPQEPANVRDNGASPVAESPGEDGAALSSSESPPAAVPPLWRMASINRARTRYVFLAYAKQHLISKEVYDYCVEMQLIDGGLARRWRLPGYERLCCTACGVPGAASLAASLTSKYALRDVKERRLSTAASQHRIDDTATCICRVPAAQRKNKHFVACAVCGCTGCCSADAVKPTATAAGPAPVETANAANGKANGSGDGDGAV